MDPSSKGSLPIVSGPGRPLEQQFLGLNFNDLATAPPSAGTSDKIIYASAHDNSRQIVGAVSTAFTGPIAKVEYHNNIPNNDRVVREKLQILQWLAPSDQWQAHTAAVKSRDPDTGLWFLGGDLLKQWLEEPASLLWIYGGVGCGKTILCSSIIQKTLEAATENESSIVCYFYCSFQDRSRQDLGAILRSFIAQLCATDTIPAPLQNLYMECQKTYPAKIPTSNQLSATLIAILQEIRSSESSSSNSDGKASSSLSTKSLLLGEGKEVFLFIDALDEIPVGQREEIFEFLNSLASKRLPRVRILLTSRDEPSIRENLTDPIQWPSVPIDTIAVETDIDLYVRRILSSHHSLRRQSADSKEAIISRLVRDSNGMFRWAALQIEMLKRKTALNHSRILTLLSELPKDLNETYARILAHIEDQGLFREAYNSLVWLAASTQPMWIEDLVEACAVRLDRIPVLDRSECQTPYNIVEMLHDLVKIQPPILKDADVPDRCHTVALAHFSVLEFLTEKDITKSSASSFGFKPEDAHDFLARSCLSYLYYYNSFSRRKERFPLREYAWYNWEKHISIPGYSTITAHDPFRGRAQRLYNSLCFESGYPPFNIDPVEVTLNRVLDWMPVNGRERLKDPLNIPYFHPKFEIFGISSEQALELSPQRHYNYRQLDNMDHSTSEIRLLAMLPSLDPRTQIRGQLIHAPMNTSQPYVALSYVWGDRNPSDHVVIDDSSLPITANLASILRRIRLRSDLQLPVLWVDALCVNISDPEEKIQQVVLMPKIYQNAQEVLISLGSEQPGDENGILAISRLASLSSNDLLSPRTSSFRQFRELVLNLFEIVVSSKATLLFGNLTLNFDIISQMMKYEPVIRTILSDNGSADLAIFLRNHSGWQAARNMALTRSEFRTSQMVPLSRALYRFRSSVQSDRRDTIYGLLGFSTGARDITPGYSLRSLSAPEVFIRTARYIMKTHKTLDTLSLCSVLDADTRVEYESMPSWVPRFDLLSAMIPISLGIFGERSDTALFTTGGADTLPVFHILSDSTLLVLSGIVFDCIMRGFELEDVELDRPLPFQIQPLWFQKVGKQELVLSDIQLSITGIPPGQTTIEAFWRAVMADQWEPGERLGRRGVRFSIVPPTTEAEEAAFLSRVDLKYHLEFPKGRNLAITSKGFPALVPKAARYGDIIAVMPGGAVPYVLSPRERKETYEFIGACYVHGIMDGEVPAAMEAEEGGYHLKAFVLR